MVYANYAEQTPPFFGALPPSPASLGIVRFWILTSSGT